MEEHCAHIIKMAIECEKASPRLIIPNFDLVVIASGHEEGLCRMEVNASDGAIVFFETVNEGSHAIIP